MAMTFHVGILGGGNISETHARAAREIDGVEIAAIYGENREKAERLGELYGGTVYTDLGSFLAHRPLEVIAIGSPSGLHAEQGCQAAQHGLHVLVEKPIDVTTERADRLIAECDKAGVKLGVFFQDRVAPDICTLKGLVDDGRLGKLFLASAHVKWYRPPEYYSQSRWRGTWALDGGGALMNQGVHTVDLLLWLIGDAARVYAKAVTALHNIEVEDTAVAVIEFANGAIATLEAATSVYPGYPRRLELTGSEGTIILEHNRIVSLNLRGDTGDVVGTGGEDGNASQSSPVVSDVSGHRKIFEDFLHAIKTNGQPRCDGREARRSVELIQAIYESSRMERAVTLNPSTASRGTM
ncbi:MAG: Gfo/Idh/MocA family oxidoreductase [Pyrinomonadaceae bacterium]|nr:Gfo/Idh/MocA family oxidoreductase [Pyrinomonadaceae bacterium]